MPESDTPSPRTRVQRVPRRATYERGEIYAVLDEALIGHVGFAHEGFPYVIPMMYARVDDALYLHASSAGRLTRVLEEGAPCTLTVTLVDGLIMARSAFHHSINYRSATVFGLARPVESVEERLRALEAFSEHLIPGRWKHIRLPSARELKATQVLVLPLEEMSGKSRTGPPTDDADDLDYPVWAGEVPLSLVAGEPRSDELADRFALPEHVREWPGSRSHPARQDL